MAHVPKAVYEKCILLGMDVYFGGKSAKDAVAEATRFGSNPTSAKDTIHVIRCMAEGQRYLRGLSAPGTDFALNEFLGRMDNVHFDNALKALLEHIEYDERRLSTTRIVLRSVLTKYETLREELPDLAALLAQEAAALATALARTPADRAARLAAADPMPKTATVTATVYLRNPDVRATVLLRANGTCEGCTKPAPFFKRSDGTPFLEVHHRIPLAEKGRDTVANAIALCPNCHREAHHGVYAEKFRA